MGGCWVVVGWLLRRWMLSGCWVVVEKVDVEWVVVEWLLGGC